MQNNRWPGPATETVVEEVITMMIKEGIGGTSYIPEEWEMKVVDDKMAFFNQVLRRRKYIHNSIWT